MKRTWKDEFRVEGALREILREWCSTSYDLAALFPDKRTSLNRWSGNKRKTHWHEAIRSELNFPFLNFFEGSLAELLHFDVVEKVSQTCFALDVVKFKFKDVSQESFIFKLAGRQTDR